MSRQTAAQLDRRYRTLIEQRTAIKDMPMETDEQRLARFDTRAAVSLALAEVYAAKREQIDPGTVLSGALLAAERNARNSAEHAEQSALNTRARIESASKDGLR